MLDPITLGLVGAGLYYANEQGWIGKREELRSIAFTQPQLDQFSEVLGGVRQFKADIAAALSNRYRDRLLVQIPVEGFPGAVYRFVPDGQPGTISTMGVNSLARATGGTIVGSHSLVFVDDPTVDKRIAVVHPGYESVAARIGGEYAVLAPRKEAPKGEAKPEPVEAKPEPEPVEAKPEPKPAPKPVNGKPRAEA